MARKLVEVVQDDLTKETITDGRFESVTFSVNGKTYAMDLTPENAAGFHEAVARYVEVATKLPGSGRVPGSQGRSRQDLSLVRQWAAENGYQVSGRGRISADVMAAYDNR